MAEKRSDSSKRWATILPIAAKKSAEQTAVKKADPRKRCCWEGKYFFDALKAIVSRLLFIFHAGIAIWRVAETLGTAYWALGIFFIVLIIECLVVLFKNRGQEWTWFQWSVFIYLLSVIPPIWLIEIDHAGQMRSLNALRNTTNPNGEVVYVDGKIVEVAPVSVVPSDWILAIEQSLLVLIIISRWMMPRGDLTRNQLSSLLLIHLGTASDIVDFLTLIGEAEIMASASMVIGVLFIWSWALLQFPFVVTVTREQRDDEEEEDDVLEVAGPTLQLGTPGKEKEEVVQQSCPEKTSLMLKTMVETEMWGICVSVFAQDGPFCIMRIIAIAIFSVVSYTNYFFATKNAIVLALQVYRLVSLCVEHEEEKKQKKAEKDKHKKKLNQLWTTFIKAQTVWKRQNKDPEAV